MGKGDKKTRKGKIYAASHGNVRPHSARSEAVVKATTSKASRPATHAPAKRPVTKRAVAKKPA